MAKPKINGNSIAFCEEYISNGYNAYKAYMVAYPKSSEQSAKGNANRLLRTPEIKAYIKDLQKERFEALNISAERIAEKLAEIAFADKKDEDYTATAQLKALDLLQKQLGLQSQKVEMNGKQDVIINIGGLDDGENQEQTGKTD